MNGKGCLGVTCGVLGVFAVFGFAICGLLGAAARWGTATGVGYAIQSGIARIPDLAIGSDYGLHVVGMKDLETFVHDTVHLAVRESGFCDHVLEQVRQNPQARAALGEPVEVADVLGVRTFSIDLASGGKANLTLELRGALGRGRLTVVAHGGPGVLQLGQLGTIKHGESEWDFDRLELYLPDSQEHIDLLFLAR
ncbi:MAG: hypothetical protein FJZ97_05575 [Chloroflexi bacterium]|nr:hypothetical protein [Chloroflexota bacterium]